MSPYISERKLVLYGFLRLFPSVPPHGFFPVFTFSFLRFPPTVLVFLYGNVYVQQIESQQQVHNEHTTSALAKRMHIISLRTAP